jgi:folate-binding protein YgfZ
MTAARNVGSALLEIDAAPTFLPIPEPGRLEAASTADFNGTLGSSRLGSNVGNFGLACFWEAIGGAGKLARRWCFDVIGHGVVCQKVPPLAFSSGDRSFRIQRMTSNTATPVGQLRDLATLLVSGPDARSFLQGQLSCDLMQLSATSLLFASCNSAQGRVQALLWLVERSEGVVLLLPGSLLDAILLRLKKYALRAKVQFAPGQLSVYLGSDQSDLASRSHIELDGVSIIGWPGELGRTLLLAPADRFGPTDRFDNLPAQDAAWHLANIRSGLPQVYPQTHEAFVAQMLNVDLLGGISFEKGCYTGQEIIARAHFRGTVKRRMLAFRAQLAAPLPGTRVVTADGQHAGDVVDAAVVQSGCELLAVINLALRDAPLHLESGAALERIALPYAIPHA